MGPSEKCFLWAVGAVCLTALVIAGAAFMYNAYVWQRLIDGHYSQQMVPGCSYPVWTNAYDVPPAPAFIVPDADQGA